MDHDATWYGVKPRPRPHCVRWGPRSSQKRHVQQPPPLFSPRLLWPNGWMDHDATWYGGIGLCQCHSVLDGNPAHPPKGPQQPPLFGACLLWPNGWMDQDATWYGGRPRPRRLCFRWGTNFPLGKWAQQPGTAAPTFRVMSMVAKRSPISATADLLLIALYRFSRTFP